MTDQIRRSGHAASRQAQGRAARSLVRSLLALGSAGLMLGGCVVEVPATGSAGAAPGYGYTCYAGVYVCQTPQQLAVNSPCSCPGLGAPSYGRVH